MPDINETLRTEGEDAVRARSDRAKKYTGNGKADDEQPSDAPQTYDPRFKLTRFKDITPNTAPNYLVKGIIPREGIVVIWGPPKCGKSFWTFDVFMHVALCWVYRGHKVRQGAVVYLALEGGKGFHGRVEAWRRKHGYDGDAPFYL